MLRSRTSKEPDLMHLLRCLFFFEAWYSFQISSSHIAGEANTLADAISRNNMVSVMQVLGPGISSHSSLSLNLIDLLINAKPDCTIRWTGG